MTRSPEKTFTRALIILLLGALLLPATVPAQKKKKKKKGDDRAVVEGTVLSLEKAPIAGATVRVSSAARPDWQADATTDAEGKFKLEISGVEEGQEYAFRIAARNYASFEAKTPLTPGEVASISFELIDAATGQRQEASKVFNAAVEEFNQENWAAAKEKFLKAVGLDPSMTEPHQGLAEIYYREKAYDLAAASIETFLASFPDDVNGLSLAYVLYRDMGNSEKTEAMVDALSKTDKAKPLSRQIYNEGVAAAQTGNNDRALERFERAAALDPTLGAALSSQATILYNTERYDEATKVLTQLFELEPESKQGRRIQYLVYDATDQQDEAAAALDAYLEIDVDGAVDVMYQRADLDFRDGNTPKAVATLEKILELRPEMARAHYTLGLCHMSGDKAKAKVYLEKFIELAPDDPEVGTAREMLSYL